MVRESPKIQSGPAQPAPLSAASITLSMFSLHLKKIVQNISDNDLFFSPLHITPAAVGRLAGVGATIHHKPFLLHSICLGYTGLGGQGKDLWLIEYLVDYLTSSKQSMLNVKVKHCFHNMISSLILLQNLQPFQKPAKIEKLPPSRSNYIFKMLESAHSLQSTLICFVNAKRNIFVFGWKTLVKTSFARIRAQEMSSWKPKLGILQCATPWSLWDLKSSCAEHN